MKTFAIIDLEGTGLHKPTREHNGRDAILEVHARVVDVKTLTQKGTFWALPMMPDHWDPDGAGMDDFVTNMHTNNGLLAARAARGLGLVWAGGQWFMKDCLPPRYTVEQEMCAFLKAHAEGDPRNLAMAGNSLGNYDIPMLRTSMPKVFDEMHYRIYDVSAVRTHYREVLGVELPKALEDAVTGKLEGNHRAADDTLMCLKTMRHLRAWAQQGYVDDPDPTKYGWGLGWTHPTDTSI